MTLDEALRRLLDEVDRLAAQETFSEGAVRRFHAVRERMHRPIDEFLAEGAGRGSARELVRQLVEALGEHVLDASPRPEEADRRRQKVAALAAQVRATLLADGEEANACLDTGWRVMLLEDRRIAVRTPANVTEALPPTAETLRAVLAAATVAQQRTPERLRPKDKRGRPGGLLTCPNAKRLLFVGDLRGRYQHLEAILFHSRAISALACPDTHLAFAGNAFHPLRGDRAGVEAHREAAALMALVAALKAQFPWNVHYLRGSFDHAHVGGITGGPGVRQDRSFAEALTRLYTGAAVLQYQAFVEATPLAARFGAPPDAVLAVHGSVPYGLEGEEALVGALMAGARSKLQEDLLWGRRYDLQALQGLRETTGVRFVLSGHAPFPEERPDRYALESVGDSPFAHRAEMQLVVGSHAATFGYLDLDLSGGLPDRVTRLRGPDGGSAMRVLGGAR